MTPNLGVMQATQQDAENFVEELQKAVLADLPGLIQGAHQVRQPGCGAQRPCQPAQARLLQACPNACVGRFAGGASLPVWRGHLQPHKPAVWDTTVYRCFSSLLYSTRKSRTSSWPCGSIDGSPAMMHAPTRPASSPLWASAYSMCGASAGTRPGAQLPAPPPTHACAAACRRRGG